MTERSKGSRSLTLEQIGERAGVSRSTVSRVLNEHPDVRPEVRARVEAVIEATGYQPNPAARALVSRKSGLIGLVMLTDADELFGDPYYSALVAGIGQGCADHGLIFAIFPVQGPGDGRDGLAPVIAQGFVDGVIVTAGPQRDELISAFRSRGTRMVVIGHPRDDAGLLRVDVENRAGTRTAIEHLQSHGYRRIGFVGATLQHRFGVERLEGYRDAITAAGATVDEQLIRLDEPTAAGGRRAAISLLADGPDAIFVATDPMAVGVYRAAESRGLRIPADVAIVGFDGLSRGPLLDPPLTTVVQPVEKVGRTAVGLLASEIDEPQVVMLPTALRLGGSCGAHETVRADETHQP